MAQQRINHNVADEKDAVLRNTLMEQILISAFLSGEEIVGNGICHNTIDLFRHSPVEAPQSRFNMRKLGNKVVCTFISPAPCLFGDQRTRRRGIHIPYYKHEVRLLIQNHTFKPLHNPSSLSGMRSRANSQAEVRLRKLQIIKKRIRHVAVVMLAGMDEDMVDLLC